MQKNLFHITIQNYVGIKTTEYLGVERSDFWRLGVGVGVFAPPLELSEEFSLW